MGEHDEEEGVAVRERVVPVDYEEFCRLVTSRLRLTRDWKSYPMRPTLVDVRSGIRYELRSRGATPEAEGAAPSC
jgi:hypothetical protein